MEKRKAIATTVVFLVIIFAISLALLLLPDAETSRAERRKLAQFSGIGTPLSEEFSGQFETYLLDQFPLRDTWRTVQAATRFYLLRQSDSNGIYLHDGGAYKLETTLNETQVSYAAKNINQICETYLSGMRVFYAVVPDKNAVAQTGRPQMDYAALNKLLDESITGAQKIDIWNLLDADDYYRTDPHWKQESIYDVAAYLAAQMGAEEGFLPASAYTPHTLSPFYGVYYGQAALPLPADELTYLTSDLTDGASVTSIEIEGELPVYAPERISGMDGYDVYLHGAQALITLENPAAQSDRELIIFRDSFGSSIAPYFLGAYSKITLVDSRYIASFLLGDYIDFAQQDVLFLYSTSILNQGMLLK